MTPRPDLAALPLEEKLNIIEQLWDSLAPAEKDTLPVPGWHLDELHRRQVEIDENQLAEGGEQPCPIIHP